MIRLTPRQIRALARIKLLAEAADLQVYEVAGALLAAIAERDAPEHEMTLAEYLAASNECSNLQDDAFEMAAELLGVSQDEAEED